MNENCNVRESKMWDIYTRSERNVGACRMSKQKWLFLTGQHEMSNKLHEQVQGVFVFPCLLFVSFFFLKTACKRNFKVCLLDWLHTVFFSNNKR